MAWPTRRDEMRRTSSRYSSSSGFIAVSPDPRMLPTPGEGCAIKLSRP